MIFTQQKYGGISRYIFELSKSLNSLSHDVKILAPTHINSYIKDEKYVIGKYIENYPKFTKKFFKYYNYFFSKKYLNLIQPDILHETYYSNYSIANSKIPKVVTVHDMIHELFYEQFPVNDKTSIMKKRSIKRADHIICISECTKNDLIELFKVPESKISVIYHGISQLGDCDILCKNELILDNPYILFVGQRNGYKNFKIILKAYASSQFLQNNFRLVAFGGGKFSDLEKQMILDLKIKTNNILHFSGDDYLLKTLYKQATIFIYPSIYEGFGFPPLEAMMYKCPTIVANTSCIPEIVGNGALLFNPYSVDDLLQKIGLVLNFNFREDLVKNGCMHYKKFTWEKCGENTLNVYKSLI
ncbi:glycosyltransferase family 4 protein [Acinetobacter brisouii]